MVANGGRRCSVKACGERRAETRSGVYGGIPRRSLGTRTTDRVLGSAATFRQFHAVKLACGKMLRRPASARARVRGKRAVRRCRSKLMRDHITAYTSVSTGTLGATRCVAGSMLSRARLVVPTGSGLAGGARRQGVGRGPSATLGTARCAAYAIGVTTFQKARGCDTTLAYTKRF